MSHENKSKPAQWEGKRAAHQGHAHGPSGPPCTVSRCSRVTLVLSATAGLCPPIQTGTRLQTPALGGSVTSRFAAGQLVSWTGKAQEKGNDGEMSMHTVSGTPPAHRPLRKETLRHHAGTALPGQLEEPRRLRYNQFSPC